MSKSAEIVPFEQMAKGDVRELGERKDSFGHDVRLLWNPEDNSVHLDIDGLDMEVPGDKALEAYEHPYPMLYLKMGEAVLEAYTVAA